MQAKGAATFNLSVQQIPGHPQALSRGGIAMRWIVLGVIAVVPIAVHGQPTSRGSSELLLRDCNAAIRHIEGDREVSLMQAQNCISYIQGYRDAMDIARRIGKLVCVPGEARPSQLARVVVAYLQGNPRELHQDKAAGLHNALITAYPCK
jgi:Rap1a immunity proteins